MTVVRDIADRTYAFSLRIIALGRALPKDTVAAIVCRQLVRSGMSVGANVQEAEAGHSKADFILKMNIARKEARESLYWLRLISDSKMIAASRMKELIAEADELVRVLTAIVRNSRK